MEPAQREPQNPTELLIAAIFATVAAILILATVFIAALSADKSSIFNIFFWVAILSILLAGAVAAWVRYFWAYIDFQVASVARPPQQAQNPATEESRQTGTVAILDERRQEFFPMQKVPNIFSWPQGCL